MSQLASGFLLTVSPMWISNIFFVVHSSTCEFYFAKFWFDNIWYALILLMKSNFQFRCYNAWLWADCLFFSHWCKYNQKQVNEWSQKTSHVDLLCYRLVEICALLNFMLARAITKLFENNVCQYLNNVPGRFFT